MSKYTIFSVYIQKIYEISSIFCIYTEKSVYSAEHIVYQILYVQSYIQKIYNMYKKIYKTSNKIYKK